MKPQVTYLSNFTVLRGIGALVIAFAHFDILLSSALKPGYILPIHHLYLVVDAFFVMSGFIMLHVYGKDFNNTINYTSFKNFIVARFARVYPLHLFTLFVMVAIFYLQHKKLYLPDTPQNQTASPRAVITNIFLLQACHIDKIYTWNIPSWSLSAEWWPYFTLPVMALWLHTKKRMTIIALLIFIPVTYLSLMYWLPRVNVLHHELPAPQQIDSTFEYGFLRGFAGFFSGLLVYKLYQKESIRRIFENDAVYLFFFIAMFGLMYIGVNDIISLVMVGGMILSAGCNSQYFHKLGKNKTLQFLGDISYSVYMTHMIVIILLLRVFYETGITKGTTVHYPTYIYFLLCLLFFAVTIIVSIITYYTIEVKARKWINEKWSGRTNTDTLKIKTGIIRRLKIFNRISSGR